MLELMPDNDQSEKQSVKDLTPVFTPRLISLSLTDNRGFIADKLEIDLDDSDGQVELPERQKHLRLCLGWKGRPLTEMGLFVVDTIQHTGAPDRVKIVASSAELAGKINAATSFSWHDATVGHIVETLAQKYGLTPKIDNDLRGIKIHIDQTGESDAAFLTRLASRNGAEVALKFGELRFFKPGQSKIPEVEIVRALGDTHMFMIADRPNFTGVTAEWLETKDPSQKNQQVTLQRKSSEQPPPPQQHPGATTPAKPAQSNTGESLAGVKGNVILLRTLYASKKQAEDAARAAWKKYQAGAAVFNLTLATGRETLKPDTPVRVKGFKKTIDDRPWIIKALTHMVNDSGYTTKLDLEVGIAGETYYIQSKEEKAN
ncbi:phage late control D family protein [Enterobacteriaceae bacterium 89]|nr:phage late control D family protein [Enterobacteriaceae bacterium 89]